MGKPRMIILVRHAQSEGNKNRDIHQFIPDHRVKLTTDGWNQAEEAGRRLRSLLKPDDTLQFFTSPYRRTRETTEGILRSLTSDDPTPSPFARHKIKVFEEPRLREQDFGNFQPCSAEMERMWQERADYGHFFYRIPNGESAADAYDRISGFNESLWRQFGEEDFPSVSVLVTHGLMTRVFLMKWYHWSVEYFEDLRNINHCEFIIMKQNPSNKKYVLQNELRTWSDLKRRAAAQQAEKESASTVSASPSKAAQVPPPPYSASPTIPVRRWGGCVNGCDHDKIPWPRKARRQNTADFLGTSALPTAKETMTEKEDHPIASQEADHTPSIAEPTPSKRKTSAATKNIQIPTMPLTPASPNDASNDASSSTDDEDVSSESGEGANAPTRSQHSQPRAAAIMRHLHHRPHVNPGEGMSDDSDYFPGMSSMKTALNGGFSGQIGGGSKLRHRANSKHRTQSKERKSIARRMSEAEWKAESGMGAGARAEKLGDGDDGITSDDAIAGRAMKDDERPILREALKGDMVVEEPEESNLEGEAVISKEEVEKMKRESRKSLDEIY